MTRVDGRQLQRVCPKCREKGTIRKHGFKRRSGGVVLKEFICVGCGYTFTGDEVTPQAYPRADPAWAKLLVTGNTVGSWRDPTDW